MPRRARLERGLQSRRPMKKIKKLSLSLQSIRNLSDDRISNDVAGGSDSVGDYCLLTPKCCFMSNSCKKGRYY